MTVIEERSLGRSEVDGMPVTERFDVVAADSSLTFFAMSTVQSAYGKTTELSGHIDAAWRPDGTLAVEPAPHMHLEFKVESLRTGNELQDREMWKLIDSKRFPKISGDLREFSPGGTRGRYAAAGQITLAGLARRYESEFTLDYDPKRVILDGEVKIDVRDFGLKPINLLVLSVAPLVRVKLHLVTARSA
jgi:polyisoprenoid-binding protein YceI